jgi:lipopolysaccharide transport system permease protein
VITPNLGTLIVALTRREIESRHKGTFGGLYWYAIQNVVLVAIYSTVFGSVFRTRWSEEGLGEADFTIALFIGLTIFNLVAETMNRAPASIVQNANLVKKVVFPLQVLPVVTVGASLFNFVIAVAIMVVAALLLSVPLSWKGLWLPVIVLPVPLLALGLSWGLAALGVYMRDIGQVIGLTTTAMMFLSPLFYPASSVPKHLAPVLLANPITIPLEQARAVLLFGRDPDPVALGLYWIAAVAVALLGYWFFQRTRRGFADVL